MKRDKEYNEERATISVGHDGKKTFILHADGGDEDIGQNVKFAADQFAAGTQFIILEPTNDR